MHDISNDGTQDAQSSSGQIQRATVWLAGRSSDLISRATKNADL
jgi:hypothetical protein